MVFLYDQQQALREFRNQLQYWKIDDKHVEQAFQFAVHNSSIHFQKLAEHLNVQHDLQNNVMQRLYVFQVGEQYVIYPVYTQFEKTCNMEFLQLTTIIIRQHPLHSIPELFKWLQYYIEVGECYYRDNEVIEKLCKLIHELQQSQQNTGRLKMCQMLVLLYSFTKGENQYSFVLRDIARMKQAWKRGKYALTTMEQTLLAYIAMMIAHTRSQWKKVVDEARFLLKQDRFMDAAIELIIEYGSLLKTSPPQPEAFIKNYRTSVFENFFFMYLEALTQLNEYEEALKLLYDYEIATTSSVYRYLHEPSEESLVAIEAAMQKNIAQIVDQSVSYVKQSIEKWQRNYMELPEAFISSKYVCLLLETLFIGEHYELFERLMSMYLKYISHDQHYECLKERISVHMALQA